MCAALWEKHGGKQKHEKNTGASQARDESERPSVTWCSVSWPQQETRRRGGERRQLGNEVGGASDETTHNQSTRQHGATSQ